MAILKNNLLFNHTYLNRLTSDNSIDAGIPFSPRDIHQWLGTSLEDLSGKSTLQNYMGDYQKGEAHQEPNALLSVLAKNKRRLAVDPGERGFRQNLERRYQESLDLLLPLKQRLAMTDRLIDQIVYKLYGLMEEEIAIVEGES